MKNFIRKVVNKILLPHSRISYSQSGEDIIVDYLLRKNNVEKPYYLDIGANHPKEINNTYYFYLRGCKGVCVEANPLLAVKLQKSRPNDRVIAKGIGIDNSPEMDFYVFEGKYDGLSTFSKTDAAHWSEVGIKEHGKINHTKVIQVPLISINTVLTELCDKIPDFISLDIEGLDMEILKTMDFNKFRPVVFCIETLLYDREQREYKNQDLIKYMISNGYKVYADTNINTIFVSQFQ